MVFKLPLCFNRDFAPAVLILYYMNVFVLALLAYLLYRFIGGFLIPVFRTTRHMRRQFHEMNGQPPSGSQPGNAPDPASKTSGKDGASKTETSKVGEYIDFEEVK
jgi:hypothetical protein